MSGFTGYSMMNGLVLTPDQAPIVLGNIVLVGHEVPSRITVGGAHAVTIHRLPGGGRVIDAMGADDGAISWSGYFTGPFAAIRARMVDRLRKTGEIVGVSFGDYVFNVVVVHFEYDLQDRGALLSYRLRMEILPDISLQTNTTPAAIASQMLVDVSSAALVLAGAGMATADDAMANLKNVLSLPGDPTSSSALSAASVALQAESLSLGAQISSCGRCLSSTVISGDYGSGGGSDLAAVVTAAGSLAAATQAAGYINRSGAWLDQLAGQPQGVSPILA